MRFRNVELAMLAVACTAALALCADFEWTGLGADDDWDTCDNWTVITGSPALCYPDDRSDDATIPWATGWDIELSPVSITMGELTIEGSVDFCTGLNQATLSLTKLTIDGSTGPVHLTNTCAVHITIE